MTAVCLKRLLMQSFTDLMIYENNNNIFQFIQSKV